MNKISISQIKEVVQQAYEQVKGNTDGKNADYIPYLANIDKNLFGISICLLNGQKITVGDYNYRFGIQSSHCHSDSSSIWSSESVGHDWR